MPDYRYKAKNRAGKDFQGLLSANTKKDALDMLARQGLYPLEVHDARQGEIDPSKWFARRPADPMIATFLHQLADLLENGVPVLNAFDVLSKQETQPVLKEMITDIHDRIAEGEDIASAFEQHSRIFSDLTISIIRAGAEGAFLEDALRRTAKFLEDQGEIRSKIVNAMIYPMILAFVGTLVVSVLLIFIVPRFEPMFESIRDRGRDLPLVTILLLQFKDLVGRYGFWFLGGGITAFIFIRIRMTSRTGRKFIDTWKLKIPLIGPVALNSSVSRLCRVLGTLLANGVPILRALEISSRSTGNMLLTDMVEQALESVASGEPLSKPLAKAGLFPASVMTMITIAEESNNLENVLVNVADGIERQLSKKLDLLVRLLEPLMLLLMAGAVFYIIVALLLPILMMTETT